MVLCFPFIDDTGLAGMNVEPNFALTNKKKQELLKTSTIHVYVNKLGLKYNCIIGLDDIENFKPC